CSDSGFFQRTAGTRAERTPLGQPAVTWTGARAAGARAPEHAAPSGLLTDAPGGQLPERATEPVDRLSRGGALSDWHIWVGRRPFSGADSHSGTLSWQHTGKQAVGLAGLLLEAQRLSIRAL